MLNLLRAGIKNVIAMNGTKLPEGIKKLSQEKDITLFVDGDRGGKLIVQNVLDNARIKYIAVAPDGKEVEELTGKEILMNLRRKMPVGEYLNSSRESFTSRTHGSAPPRRDFSDGEESEINDESREKLKNIFNKNKTSGKAIFLDSSFEEIKSVSVKSVSGTLKRLREKTFAIVIDGTANNTTIQDSEEAGIKMIAAKNFTTTDTRIKLFSF